MANDPSSAASTLNVCHVLAPGAVGGLESVVQALAMGQHRAGTRVAVVSIIGPGESDPLLHRALREAGIEVVGLLIPPRRYLREWRALEVFFLERRPQVVHTHGYRPDVIAGRVARALKIPTVTTVHGFTGGGWRNRLYERLQCAAFRRFDAVIAVSRPLVDRLRSVGVPPERVHCVPNAWGGVERPVDRLQARARLGVPTDTYLVGWVGRLGREKGADLLLEAMAHLRDIPLIVSFIGDGAERARLQDQTAVLNLTDRVRWHGTVPEAARFYSAFDCFVLSSRTEGTPIALFEAMNARVPVVATRVGGVPDIVTPAEALLVAAEDPIALAGAVRRLYAEPRQGATLADRAHDLLEARFGLAPWIERHLALYQSIQSPSPVPRRP